MLLKTKSRRYILFLQFQWSENIVDLVRSNIEHIIKQASDFSSDVFVGVVGKPSLPRSKNRPAWITTLNEVDNVLMLDNVNKAEVDSNKVAEDIHALADKFPSAGYHLDIIWPVTIETVFPIESHLALFGALQRLKTWHNAHLTVAMSTTDYSWSMDTWLTYLRGETKLLTRDCGNLIDWDLVWRGDLKFTNGKGIASVTLPGFSLMEPEEEEPIMTLDLDEEEKTDDEEASSEEDVPYDDVIKELTAFDRNLDVIHIVNLSDVPRCLVSAKKFILSITPGDRLPRTSNLYTWLVTEGHEQGMALLTRVGGTRAMESTLLNIPSDAKMKTEDWKTNMHQVPSIEVKGQPFAWHLLIHGDEDGNCVARVMHSPSQMNAAIHVKIATSQIQFDGDENPGLSFIQDVPLYEGNELLEMENEISQLQIEAIKNFIDLRVSEGADCSISIDELKELMGSVRREYVTETSPTCSSTVKHYMDENRGQEHTLESIPTELDQEPSEWLERLFIHHKESVEKKMKRYKSSDMMLGGMVVKKCKDNTIRLNAEEFLRHFQSDGHAFALEEALSPIGVMNENNSKSSQAQDHKLDTKTLMNSDLEFDVMIKHKAPDIRYNIDLETAQKVEDHFARMQQKLVWNETACTCTMEQAASPATMEIRTTKPKPGVRGQTRRKSTDSAKKRVQRGVKRKVEEAESSQASKRRLLRGNAVEETFAKPTSTARVRRRSQSQSPHGVAVRSSPRRKNQLSKIAGVTEDVKRRVSLSRPRSSSSSSNKVTTVTFDAAARKRKSSSVSSAAGSTSSGGERSGSSSGAPKSRKQKHTEILQAIVLDTLKDNGITKDHPIYPQCSKRLFQNTKDFIRALPPKSYTSLRDEMKNIATQQVGLVISIEQRIHQAKDKK